MRKAQWVKFQYWLEGNKMVLNWPSERKNFFRKQIVEFTMVADIILNSREKNAINKIFYTKKE